MRHVDRCGALLPLCILGLNRLIDNGRAALYTVSLALIVFTNYYMAIMVCIFIIGVLFCPVFYEEQMARDP
ncbi:MAG: YfhO family protein [Clostridia bacterium]